MTLHADQDSAFIARLAYVPVAPTLAINTATTVVAAGISADIQQSGVVDVGD